MKTSENSLTVQKQNARKKARAVRAKLHEQSGKAARKALRDTGLDFCGVTRGATISGYVASYSEIDPAALLSVLSARGHGIGLPVVAKPATPLEFRSWAPGEALVAGVFGIAVPDETAVNVRPDVLLVPLLSFDQRGYRLGYGGGFYDRTIEKLESQGAVTTVGLAYAGQQVDAVPTDQHDRKLDWILTEKGPLKCG